MDVVLLVFKRLKWSAVPKVFSDPFPGENISRWLSCDAIGSAGGILMAGVMVYLI